MNKLKLTMTLIALASLVLVVASAALAGPKITKVELGQAVADGYYVVALDTSDPYGMASSSTLKGIWINPEETSGDVDTLISNPVAVVSPAEMFNAGDKSVYPAILISLPTSTLSMGMELLALLQNQNPVLSQNEDVSQIPTNINNIDLSRAIPASTTVTFTVDMDGEPLHAVAVMGGTEPVVTYDASANENKGTLTVETTTFKTTNAADQTLESIVGFMLVTNSQGGPDPLRIILQTNTWGGDVLSFPAMTDGTMGTVNTMLGITAYGPAGESRDMYVFFPDAAIGPVFGTGSGFQPTDLAMFLDSQQLDSATIEYGVSKEDIGVASGTEMKATYTFSASGRSPRSDGIKKDVTVGIRSDAEVWVVKDVDGDRKAGLAEVIKILQDLTGGETSVPER